MMLFSVKVNLTNNVITNYPIILKWVFILYLFTKTVADPGGVTLLGGGVDFVNDGAGEGGVENYWKWTFEP